MLYVGLGSTSFEEVMGHYTIQDYLEERVGLTDFTITYQNDSHVISLSTPAKRKVSKSSFQLDLIV